jgi:hypothetical protein
VGLALWGGSPGLSGIGAVTPGTTPIVGGTNTRVLFDDNGVIGESANLTFDKTNSILTLGADVNFVRQAANTLALRNGVNPQVTYVYGTYTDASNYERAIVGFNSASFEFGSEISGTGVSRNVRIKAAGASSTVVFAINGSDRWYFSSAAHLLAISDNTYDVGASGSSRPRNVYIGTSIVTGSTTLHTTSVALTNGAAAAAGTLLNAPVAGNPTKWVPINDNGTTRYIPAW